MYLQYPTEHLCARLDCVVPVGSYERESKLPGFSPETQHWPQTGISLSAPRLVYFIVRREICGTSQFCGSAAVCRALAGNA